MYEPGNVIGGRFRLTRLLDGGQGQTFEATTSEGGGYLVRCIAFESSDSRARFLREARVSGALSHPNVLPVLSHGIEGATGYLIQPRLPGETLAALLARLPCLEPRAAARVVLQACTGLDAAHRAGVIHRDLKPENLVIEQAPDGQARVRLAGFGLARQLLAEEALTQTGSAIGTPLYMAPEQARNAKDVDARADVWSLGVTLYHALCGHPPLEGVRTMHEWLDGLTQRDPPPIQGQAPWVDPELAEILHGVLLRDLDARCPSADELGAALRDWLGSDEPLLVADLRPPDTTLRQARAITAIPPQRWSELRAVSTVRPATDDLLGVVLGGKYRLDALLGRGGMGAVYRASDPGGKGVAVKIIRPDAVASKDALRRFVREARASAAIDSPHVARTLDAGTDEARGVPFLVMELLEGNDLDHLIKEVGPLSPEPTVAFFVHCCEALSVAHGLGVVHRDIKPANLFLHCSPGGQITPKICDFGVAKRTRTLQESESTDLTHTGGLLGSPLYMSPEQAQNAKEVDARTDIWSLAISLYEALGGANPWRSCSTFGDLMMALFTREVPPLQDAAPWIEPELAEVVHRGLERDPDLRYPSAQAFADALRPLAFGGVLTRDALRGVAGERKSIPARRSSLVDSRSSSRQSASAAAPSAAAAPAPAAAAAPASSAAVAPTPPAAPPAEGPGAAAVARLAPTVPPRASRTPWVVGGLLVFSLGAFGLWVRRPPPAASAGPPASSVSRVRASVEIRPPGARVRVDGVEQTLEQGRLVLERPPGEGVLVELEHQGVSASTVVLITSNGRTIPPIVEVSSPPASAPASSPPPPASSPPLAPRPTAPPRATEKAAKVTPPEPPPAPSGPKLKDKW